MIPFWIRRLAYCSSEYPPFKTLGRRYYEAAAESSARKFAQIPEVSEICLKGASGKHRLVGLSDLDFGLFLGASCPAANKMQLLDRMRALYSRLKSIYPMLGEVELQDRETRDLLVQAAPGGLLSYIEQSRYESGGGWKDFKIEIPKVSASSRFAHASRFYVRALLCARSLHSNSSRDSFGMAGFRREIKKALRLSRSSEAPLGQESPESLLASAFLSLHQLALEAKDEVFPFSKPLRHSLPREKTTGVIQAQMASGYWLQRWRKTGGASFALDATPLAFHFTWDGFRDGPPEESEVHDFFSAYLKFCRGMRKQKWARSSPPAVILSPAMYRCFSRSWHGGLSAFYYLDHFGDRLDKNSSEHVYRNLLETLTGRLSRIEGQYIFSGPEEYHGFLKGLCEDALLVAARHLTSDLEVLLPVASASSPKTTRLYRRLCEGSVNPEYGEHKMQMLEAFDEMRVLARYALMVGQPIVRSGQTLPELAGTCRNLTAKRDWP